MKWLDTPRRRARVCPLQLWLLLLPAARLAPCRRSRSVWHPRLLLPQACYSAPDSGSRPCAYPVVGSTGVDDCNSISVQSARFLGPLLDERSTHLYISLGGLLHRSRPGRIENPA